MIASRMTIGSFITMRQFVAERTTYGSLARMPRKVRRAFRRAWKRIAKTPVQIVAAKPGAITYMDGV